MFTDSAEIELFVEIRIAIVSMVIRRGCVVVGWMFIMSFGVCLGVAMCAMSVMKVLVDMLERQLRWIFPSPFSQLRSDRFGIFKTRDVMTCVTAILRYSLRTDVM